MHIPTAARWAFLANTRLASPAVHGHEAHARLHHPAGEQKILAERMHAVALTHLYRLATHIKRFAPLSPGHRVVSFLAQITPVAAFGVLVQRVALDAAEQFAALSEAISIT